MNTAEIKKIAGILDALSKELDSLEDAGKGIPAVEKNAVRMRGALRQLKVQFSDLAAIS